MIATLVFTFTNINLTQAEPLRFVGLDNYANAGRRPADLGIARGHPQVRAPGPAGRGPRSVRASRCCSTAATSRAPGIFRILFFLPYVVPFVAGVLIWQSMLNTDSGWINEFLRLARASPTRRTGCRTRPGSTRASS